MRTPSLLATALLSLCISLPAQAQVYKWKDAQGNTVISDTPQVGTGKQAPAAPSVTGNGSTPAAEKSWAEKDLELKKRQMEGKEKTEKSSKEKTAADEKKENCERAKRQQATLESGERMTVRNAQGEREYLDDDQRQQELERTKRAVKELCQ